MALVYMNEIMPESLVDMDGDVKITEQRCPQNPNTSLFKLEKEDHTVANMLRMKLHEDTQVKIAGYRVPHPTQHNVEIRVQTASDATDKPVPTPKEALSEAIRKSLKELEELEVKFTEAAARKGIEYSRE